MWHRGREKACVLLSGSRTGEQERNRIVCNAKVQSALQCNLRSVSAERHFRFDPVFEQDERHPASPSTKNRESSRVVGWSE